MQKREPRQGRYAVSARARCCFAPSGLDRLSSEFPRLAPWAQALSRLRRSSEARRRRTKHKCSGNDVCQSLSAEVQTEWRATPRLPVIAPGSYLRLPVLASQGGPLTRSRRPRPRRTRPDCRASSGARPSGRWQPALRPTVPCDRTGSCRGVRRTRRPGLD